MTWNEGLEETYNLNPNDDLYYYYSFAFGGGARMGVWEMVSGSSMNFKLCTFDPKGQSISILRIGSCIH